jgi:hypothetical protein
LFSRFSSFANSLAGGQLGQLLLVKTLSFILLK